MDYAANHDNFEGDEEVNETLQRASYSEHKNGTLVRVATDGAEMPTSAEGGSEGGTQRIIDILQTAAVESPAGEQSSNLYDYGYNYRRLKELLEEFAKPLSTQLLQHFSTVTAEATATSGDRRLEGSTVVVDEDSTRPNQDLENGGVPDESTGGGVAVETSSGDYHQDNDDEFECRICQMSTATDVVINLGCRCKFNLSRAHGVCAETWFRFKGNRQCEICGKIAKNVQIPKAMDNNAPSRQDTSILNNARWSFAALLARESDESEDAQNGLAPPAANNGHLPTNGSTLATTGVLNFLYRKRFVIARTVVVISVVIVGLGGFVFFVYIFTLM